MPEISQEDILNRLKSDDKTALKALFEQYYPQVCRAIYRIVREQSTVEDLAQEVFLRFWQKRDQIEINSSVGAYLRRMAINEALGYHRKKKMYAEEINDDTLAGTSPGVERSYLHGELEDQIRQAIDLLPPKCRTVFQLSRFEDLSYREIAEQMNISIKTVENQMGKALKILRKELKQYLHIFL